MGAESLLRSESVMITAPPPVGMPANLMASTGIDHPHHPPHPSLSPLLVPQEPVSSLSSSPHGEKPVVAFSLDHDDVSLHFHHWIQTLSFFFRSPTMQNFLLQA